MNNPDTYGDQLDQSDKEVFIGARTLDEEQIQRILPTYHILREQIEQMREAAKNHQNQEREINNTISIFGGRGTGKTSAMYTIKAALAEEKYNIILDIIEPDNFGENTKIMGSIIGLLSDYVDTILGEIKKYSSVNEKLKDEFFNNCHYKENNSLNRKRRDLIEYHLYTESQYRNLLTYNYHDTATHIKKSSYLLTPDIKFKEKFIDLVNEIVKVQKELHKGIKKEPMIFIFIDDIDLKTTKCKELIEAVLQYANHKNLVTVLSGDYDILKESLTMALIAEESLKECNMRPQMRVGGRGSILSLKRDLANEYLKKVIPPARRHSMVKWNNNTLPYFSFGDVTLQEKLDKLLGDKNFFSYKEKEKLIPLSYAYGFFDHTPRGIINVYFHIDQVLKNRTSNNGTFENIKALVDTIILSSSSLINYQEYILNKVIVWGGNAFSSFVDYEKLFKDLYKATNYKEGKKVDFYKSRINIFLICELVIRLLPNIRRDKANRGKVEVFCITYLYWDEFLNHEYNHIDAFIENMDENHFVRIKAWQNQMFINDYMIPIAYKLGLGVGLVLLEYLKEKIKRFEYSEDEIASDNDKAKYYKQMNAFVALYKLHKNYKQDNLLKQIILQASQENFNEEYYYSNTLTLQFIQRMILESVDYVDMEIIFKDIQIRVTKGINEQNVNFKTYRGYFINALSVISDIDEQELLDQYNFKGEEEVFKNNEKYYLRLKSLNNKEDKKISNIQGDIVKAGFKKICDQLTDILVTSIKNQKCNRVFSVKNKEIYTQAIEEFNKGRDGTSNTIYHRAKSESGLLCLLFDESGHSAFTVDDYIKSIEVIYELSINNRAWYGRSEAFKLYALIREQVYFSLDQFGGLNLVIKELYKHFSKLKGGIKADNEFKIARDEMSILLQEAYEEAREDIGQDVQGAGLSLAEFEEMTSGDSSDD